MRAKLQIRAVALILLIIVSTASGKLVRVDADSHAPGADISNVFPGVRLAALYEPGVPKLDGKVYSRQAYDPAFASTGTNVFGSSAAGADAYGKPRNETWVYPFAMLGVQLYDPADSVAIDVIGDGVSDFAAVEVYDAGRAILEWAVTPEFSAGDVLRIEFTRDSFDIAFVIAYGVSSGGSYYAVYFDNFEANVIPEPATFLLLGLGGLVLRKRRP